MKSCGFSFIPAAERLEAIGLHSVSVRLGMGGVRRWWWGRCEWRRGGRLSNPSKSGLLERDERVLGTSEGGSDDSVDDGDALLALVEPAT